MASKEPTKKTLDSKDIWGDQDAELAKVNGMTDEELIAKTKKFNDNIRSMKGELTRINHENKKLDEEFSQN